MSSRSGKKAEREETYWDASVFIDYIAAEKPGRKAIIDTLVARAKEGKLLVITSAATRGEVIRGPGADSLPEDDRRYLKAFFDNDWISIRATDSKIWDAVADIRRQHKLKLPDAIHVATASRWGLLLLETSDENHLTPLDRVFGVPPLRIKMPRLRGEPLPLFDDHENDGP